MKHPLDVTFFMLGGHEIKATGVDQLTMQTDNSTGRFTSYKLTWHPGWSPAFFSLTLNDIVAVVAVENKNYEL